MTESKRQDVSPADVKRAGEVESQVVERPKLAELREYIFGLLHLTYNQDAPEGKQLMIEALKSSKEIIYFDEVIEIIRKFGSRLTTDQIDEIIGNQARHDNLKQMDSALIKAINNVIDEYPDTGAETACLDIIRSLYQLQIRIIILKCKQITPTDAGRDLFTSLIVAFNNKLKALNTVLDERASLMLPDETAPAPVTLPEPIAGGSLNNSESYKYKYLKYKTKYMNVRKL